MEICKISNSWILDRSQRPLAVSVTAIYSTLVEERATVAFFFVRHAIAPLMQKKTKKLMCVTDRSKLKELERILLNG